MLRVKEICEHKGMTLQQLAAKLGITYQSLWSQISGNPTLSKLEALASALGVQVVDLFERPADSAPVGVCPHCGKPIKVKLEE